MKRAPKEAAALFPDFGPEGVTYDEAGYVHVFVSVFDHWLTEEEVNSCDILFYRVAVEAGKTEEYMAGEHRFMSFYRALAQDGAYVREGKGILLTEADDPAFTEMLKNSLRETNASALMHVHFINSAVNAAGGWDRTDQLFARSKEALTALEPIAREHGVYILHPHPLE